MRARHSDIETLRAIQRDQGILIDERRVIIRGLHISMSAERDQPGPRPYKRFALDRAKGLFNPRIPDLGCGADKAGIERMQIFRPLFHDQLPALRCPILFETIACSSDLTMVCRISAPQSKHS